MVMAGSGGSQPRRSQRVDALSNRTRIIAAARRAFGSGGGGDSLDDIAAAAGVGIATLYRNFPNREALARAVYDDLLDTEIIPLLRAKENSDAAREALIAIAERLLDLLSEERGLVTFASNFVELTEDALRRVSGSLQLLLLRAQEAGQVRDDLVADDIPRILVMAVAALTLPGTSRPTRSRYLTLLFDALDPVHRTPLPPLDPDGADLRRAIGTMGAQER